MPRPPRKGKPPQKCRQLKVGCKCGIVGRMSRKAIDASHWRCWICGEIIGEIK